MFEMHLLKIVSILNSYSAEWFCTDLYYNNIELASLLETEITLLCINEALYEITIEVH